MKSLNKHQAGCATNASRKAAVPARSIVNRKSSVVPKASSAIQFGCSRPALAQTIYPTWRTFGTSQARCLTRASATAEQATEKKDERIPVTVITGFLGSGKTTLLNHILTANHGRRIAVIENEFGEIDIDSELVAKKEILEGSNDTIMQLSNGCLCCTVREDLINALNRLYDRRNEFDHVIIETTGLANPAPIISSFYMDQSLPDKVRLDGVVTVVDAKHITKHLNVVKPEDVVNEAVEQIAYADRILLNKIDLVNASELTELEGRIRDINKLAAIQRTQKSNVDVEYVLGVGGFDLNNVESELNQTLKRDGHHVHNHDHKHDHEHDCAGAGCTHESHSHDHKHEHDHDCAGADCKHESHSHSHAHAHSHDHDHKHEHDHECAGANCTHESHSHSHDHSHAHKHQKHDDKVSSVSFYMEGDMDIDKINYSLGLLLETRSEDIYRMKGLLSIHGSQYRYVYHGVHAIFEGVPDREWRPDEKRVNKMVFIGRELDREAFEDAFKHCLVKKEEKKEAAAVA